MINIAKVRESLAGLIGFFPPYNPEVGNLPAVLTQSSSGLYIQDMHPLCTLENVYNSSPDFESYNYQEFNADSTYKANTIVKHDYKFYRAAQDITSDYPEPGAAGADNWHEVNLPGEWMLGILTHSSVELLNDIIRYKQLNHANKTILESLMLYDGLGSLNDRIIKRDRFVGLEISLTSREASITAIIDSIGMQLDAAQELDLYLYHSSSDVPVAQFTANFTKSRTFNWIKLEQALHLSYFAQDYDSTGVFYLGYYESDLLGQAIHRKSELSTSPCIGCSNWNYSAWTKWSKHIKLRPIYVSVENLNAERTLFDTGKVAVQADTNWGMNFSLTVVCDSTELFIRNLYLLVEPLAMKAALKLMTSMAYTNRMNPIVERIRPAAAFEISKEAGSFFNKYMEQIKATSLLMDGLSKECFPCTEKKIRIGAV